MTQRTWGRQHHPKLGGLGCDGDMWRSVGRRSLQSIRTGLGDVATRACPNTSWRYLPRVCESWKETPQLRWFYPAAEPLTSEPNPDKEKGEDDAPQRQSTNSKDLADLLLDDDELMLPDDFYVDVASIGQGTTKLKNASHDETIADGGDVRSDLGAGEGLGESSENSGHDDQASDMMFPSQYEFHPEDRAPLPPTYRRLMRMTEWEDLRDALKGRESDPVWLETAWNQLKVIGKDPKPDRLPEWQAFVQEMSEHTIRIAHDLQPRNHAGIIHSCAKLDHWNADLLQKLGESLLQESDQRAYSPRNLSNILYGLGVLRRRMTYNGELGHEEKLFPMEEEVVEACVSQMMSRLNELNQHDLSMFIYALGLMDYSGDDRFYQALMDEVQRPWHLEKFSDMDIITIAFGLTKAKRPHLVKACLGLFREAMQPERLKNFRPREMVLFLRCLMNPQVVPTARREIDFVPLMQRMISLNELDEMGVLTLRTVVLAMGIFRIRNLELWERVTDFLMKERWLDWVRAYDTTMVLYAMGVARYYRVSVLESICENLMKSAPFNFGANGVSNVVFGLGQLRYKHKGVVSEIVKYATQPGFLEECRNLQVSNIAFSLGQIRSKTETLPLGEVLAKHIVESGRMDGMSNHLLVNALFGLINCGVVDPTLMIPLLNEMMSEERVRTMTTAQISMAMFCVGAFSSPITASIEPMLARLRDEKCRASFDSKDVARVMRALGRVKVQDREVPELIMGLLGNDGVKVTQIKDAALVDLMEAMTMLDMHGKGYVRVLVREAIRGERVARFTTSELSRAMQAVSRISIRRKFNGVLEDMLEEILAIGRLKEMNCNALFTATVCLGSFKTCNPQTLSQFAMEVTHSDRIPNYTSKNMAALFHNLAVLKPPERLVLKRLTDVLRLPGTVVELNPLEMMSILQGMYTSRWHDKLLLTTLFNHFLSEARLPTFSPNTIANVIYGMTLVPGWQEPWVSNILNEAVKPERVSCFGNWELGVIIYSVGRVGHNDARVVGILAKELLQKNRLETMSSLDLVNVAHGLAKVAFQDQEIVDALVGEVLSASRLEQHSNEELVRIANACSTWKPVDRRRLGGLIKKITSPENLDSLRSVQLLILFQALVRLRHSDKQVLNDVLSRLSHVDRLVELRDKDLYTLSYLMDVQTDIQASGRERLNSEMQKRHLVRVALPNT
ncbi:hypothetical protein BSKO_12024 [Bryopsis sp. KO-2023]|nr:hypothetical protein BSKO_12024 [Bryopsis sp. KO-2023]